MKIEYAGSITEIRAIEDCIRATKKYTEGLLSKKHPQSFQGEDFPSRVLHKHYEVYPNVPEISWNMPVNMAMDWLFADTPCINVSFRYDYRTNQATVTMRDEGDVMLLKKVAPGLAQAIGAITKHNTIIDIVPDPIQRTADV
jgi:hypothetical protein